MTKRKIHQSPIASKFYYTDAALLLSLFLRARYKLWENAELLFLLSRQQSSSSNCSGVIPACFELNKTTLCLHLS
jgi:hypothetical protein